MIYLDSSAIMKLVRPEAETTALIEWLEHQTEEGFLTSELGRVEVLRAARRVGDESVVVQAHAVLAELDLITLDRVVQDLACDLAESGLRTSDALHLASALLLREHLDTFVAYDQPLALAARDSRLNVVAPGLTS
ncbi:MAG: PIN domain-containing protein [Ornithinimicrobium sp.]